MDRQQTLLELAHEIGAASAGDDWPALAACSRTLASRLLAMDAQGPWSRSEQEALATLRSGHSQAYDRCAQATASLGELLRDMQDNKEGRIAYALDGETDLDGITA